MVAVAGDLSAGPLTPNGLLAGAVAGAAGVTGAAGAEGDGAKAEAAGGKAIGERATIGAGRAACCCGLAGAAAAALNPWPEGAPVGFGKLGATGCAAAPVNGLLLKAAGPAKIGR